MQTIKKTKWIAILITILGLYNISSSVISITSGQFLFSILTKSIMIFSDFSSLLTGFILTILGYGLYKRYNLAFKITVILLVISLLFNLLSGFNIIGAIISGILLLLLYSKRSVFIHNLGIRISTRHVIAFWIILFVMIYGIVGSYFLGTQFDPHIETLIQALYYTVVTATTVGYGDFTPVTDTTRLFSVSLIILGVGTFLSAVALIIQPLFQSLEKNYLNLLQKKEELKK